MGQKNFILFLLVPAFILSGCIDRDSVVGTGRNDPFKVFSTAGNGQTIAVGTKLSIPFSVKIVTEKDLPVRGTQVQFSIIRGSGILTDSIQTTDYDGISRSYLTAGAAIGKYEIHAIVPGLKGSPVIFQVDVTAGPSKSIVIIAGNNQTGSVGQVLASNLTAMVTDDFGNPISGVTVYFVPSAHSGSVTPATTTTNTSGVVTATWTLDTIAGIQNVEAKISRVGVNPAIFSATGRALTVSSSVQIVSGNNQFGVQGRILKENIVVSAKDRYGNLIPSFVHQFKVLSGGGSVSPASVTSGSDGTASTQFTLGTNDSSQRLEVSNQYQSKNAAIVQAFGYHLAMIDTLKMNNGAVYITWEKNIHAGFLSYKVYRHTSDLTFETNAQLLATVTDLNSMQYTDAGITSGQEYYYGIQFSYTNGFSFFTDRVKITIP